MASSADADAPYRDAATLRRLYCDEEQSSDALADRFGVSQATILYWLKEHDIDLRDPGADPGEPVHDQRIPDHELLLDLRAGAAVLGRAPKTVDVKNYGQYSWKVYQDRWQTRAATLEAAGIDPETGDVVEPLDEFLERMGVDEDE